MTTTTAAPVRFTQRPDHSLVLGLSAARAVTLAVCVLVVAAVTVTSGMTTGLVTVIGISPVAGSALLTVEGRALIEWTPDAARYVWRGANGRLRVLAKPDRPMPAGVLPIPGTAAQLTVFAAVDGSAILHDVAADTWTAIASVTGTNFLYADAETQDAATAGFGRALAAIGSDGQIQRIHIIHRTRPDNGSLAGYHGTIANDEAKPRGKTVNRNRAGQDGEIVDAAGATSEQVDRAGQPRGSSAAVAAYREALDEHRAAWWHGTLIAITLGGKAARAAIRRAGHGRTAAARVLTACRTGLHETLASADVDVDSWLTPTEVIDWIRDSFDPASIALHPVQPQKPVAAEPAIAGASTDVAGPMAVGESWSTVRTDSAWHQVLWVSGWPRFDTHPAFLASVILPAGATVTVSFVYEPISTPVALRQIGRDKTAQASDAALRSRIGTLDTAEQVARETDTLQRETEIAEGHLDMRHTALIAITAATRDEMTDAATRIRQAVAAGGCETRILYGQQLAALNATMLPAGLRL